LKTRRSQARRISRRFRRFCRSWKGGGGAAGSRHGQKKILRAQAGGEAVTEEGGGRPGARWIVYDKVVLVIELVTWSTSMHFWACWYRRHPTLAPKDIDKIHWNKAK
jgi:hypothetical protein